MSFKRSLDERQISALFGGKNIELYKRLQEDILAGEVFPTVRKNQLHFYYKGGCLYKFSNGAFTRNSEYVKYGLGATDLSEYEAAKRQNENRFTNAKGDNTERQLLDSLNRNTFGVGGIDTVVLDIEVNLNGGVERGKKCDLVLYNLPTRTLAFVEGKVFSDRRVNVARGNIPEVIGQVNIYTAAICEQDQTIIEQYGNHVKIVNRLFGTSFEPPLKVIKPAKLIVYETPLRLTENNKYSIDIVNSALGRGNVAWFKQGDRPQIDVIWKSLCK